MTIVAVLVAVANSSLRSSMMAEKSQIICVTPEGILSVVRNVQHSLS